MPIIHPFRSRKLQLILKNMSIDLFFMIIDLFSLSIVDPRITFRTHFFFNNYVVLFHPLQKIRNQYNAFSTIMLYYFTHYKK